MRFSIAGLGRHAVSGCLLSIPGVNGGAGLDFFAGWCTTATDPLSHDLREELCDGDEGGAFTEPPGCGLALAVHPLEGLVLFLGRDRKSIRNESAIRTLEPMRHDLSLQGR